MSADDTSTPRDFELKVAVRAKHFELAALLRLLEAHGYPGERIFFESCAELASAGSLVESVRFWDHDGQNRAEARARSTYVTITVNLGLLGGQGLLPAYFHDALKESREPERLLAFLRFFDQRLLAGLVRAAYPERDAALFPDLAGTRRSLFQMLGVASPSTLHWLFQWVFPELRLQVARRALPRADEAFGARTGLSALDGTAVVGKVYQTMMAGFAVRLCSDHEHHDHGERWFDVASARLHETVLPLLTPFRFALRVELDMPHRTAAVVEPDKLAWFEEASRLGYQRVLGQLPEGIAWPARDDQTRAAAARWETALGPRHVVELFRGNVGELSRATAPTEGERLSLGDVRQRLLMKPRHSHIERGGV